MVERGHDKFRDDCASILSNTGFFTIGCFLVKFRKNFSKITLNFRKSQLKFIK